MAKLGEKRHWRIVFKWENGVHGTITASSREHADWHADRIRHNAELRGMAVQVEIKEPINA